MNFADNTVERLLQEHAIYKAFFEAMLDRPRGGKGVSEYWKANAFDVQERIKNLNSGVPYYDPAWKDADSVLFSVLIT